VAFHHQAGETPAYEVVAATAFGFGFGFGKGDAYSHTRRRPGSGGPTSAHNLSGSWAIVVVLAASSC
jgi:hypothetical protein